MSVTREQIVAAAREWLGTPFRHQGRLKGVGVDCAGVLEGVATQLGLVPEYLAAPARAEYARQPDGTLNALLDKYLVRVPLTQREPGDVALVAWSRLPQHVGIFTSTGTLLHAYESAHKVVEVTWAGGLQRMTRACYRFPELPVGDQ
jgi:NlpC/P60 family putative phage cell wall peptidase